MTKSMITDILEGLLLTAVLGYAAVDGFLKIRKWIKKKMRGPRSTSSWGWRRAYSKEIFNLLPAEINDIAEMWEISWGAMTPKTLAKMLTMVEYKLYCMFDELVYTVPVMVDDFGDFPVPPYYRMIAIVRKTNQVDVLILAQEAYTTPYKLVIHIPKTGLKLWAIKNKRFVYPD